MAVSTDPKKIEELLSRGVAEIIDRESLEAKLKSGKQLRVKLGIDPTSPHLHLGRSLPLLKLRDFQELGHKAVLIVGDFTGTIGDTSDKDSERPMLGRGMVEENMKTYVEQAGQILKTEEDVFELRYNSKWLEGIKYSDVLFHASLFSVNDFISRELVAKRLKEGKRVGLHETLYPLLQGCDSVAVQADVELGGTDQRFNLLAGRTLQRACGQAPQDILMNPLLPGTDGRKMSSSWGNIVSINTFPHTQFQDVMKISDDLIPLYAEMATRMPLSEVEKFRSRLESKSENPRDIKMDLAEAIVTMYHGPEAAEGGRRYFTELLTEGHVPADAPQAQVAGLSLVDALVAAGLAESKSEARRVIEQRGVKVSGEPCEDPARVLAAGETLERGKGRAVRVA